MKLGEEVWFRLSNSKLVCNISGGMFSTPHSPRNHPKNKIWQFWSDLDETLWGPPEPPFHPHFVVDPSAYQIFIHYMYILLSHCLFFYCRWYLSRFVNFSEFMNWFNITFMISLEPMLQRWRKSKLIHGVVNRIREKSVYNFLVIDINAQSKYPTPNNSLISFLL